MSTISNSLNLNTFDVYIFILLFRLTNSIIEFDQKLLALPLRVDNQSPGPVFWATILIFYLIFNITLHTYIYNMIRGTKEHTLHLMIEGIFTPPRVMDFIIVVIICFYLCHFGHRFVVLNTTWRRLLPTRCPENQHNRKRTTTETAVLMESLRILHTELSDLLRMFNSSFGPIILAIFVFLFVDVVFNIYFLLIINDYIVGFAPCFLYTEIMMSIYSVLSIATWTNDMVTIGAVRMRHLYFFYLYSILSQN